MQLPRHLAAAERRFAAVQFPYQRAHWGWSAGLAHNPAAAQAQALANEALAQQQADRSAQMAADPIEAAAYRAATWSDARRRWSDEAAFWAAVAAEAATLIPAQKEAA